MSTKLHLVSLATALAMNITPPSTLKDAQPHWIPNSKAKNTGAAKIKRNSKKAKRK